MVSVPGRWAKKGKSENGPQADGTQTRAPSDDWERLNGRHQDAGCSTSTQPVHFLLHVLRVPLLAVGCSVQPFCRMHAAGGNDEYSAATLRSLAVVDEALINNDLLEALVAHLVARGPVPGQTANAMLIFLPGAPEISRLVRVLQVQALSSTVKPNAEAPRSDMSALHAALQAMTASVLHTVMLYCMRQHAELVRAGVRGCEAGSVWAVTAHPAAAWLPLRRSAGGVLSPDSCTSILGYWTDVCCSSCFG